MKLKLKKIIPLQLELSSTFSDSVERNVGKTAKLEELDFSSITISVSEEGLSSEKSIQNRAKESIEDILKRKPTFVSDSGKVFYLLNDDLSVGTRKEAAFAIVNLPPNEAQSYAQIEKQAASDGEGVALFGAPVKGDKFILQWVTGYTVTFQQISGISVDKLNLMFKTFTESMFETMAKDLERIKNLNLAFKDFQVQISTQTGHVYIIDPDVQVPRELKNANRSLSPLPESPNTMKESNSAKAFLAHRNHVSLPRQKGIEVQAQNCRYKKPTDIANFMTFCRVVDTLKTTLLSNSTELAEQI